VAEAPGWQPHQPIIRRQGPLFTIGASRATTIAGDDTTGYAFGFISHAAAVQAEFVRVALVQSAAFNLLAARSLAPMHAACLVKDGRTVLLRGASGAGKTTLTYAA